MVKYVFLVRHCDSSGPLPSAPLTPLGQRQARILAAYLARQTIDLLVSSPYTRAQQFLHGLGVNQAVKLCVEDVALLMRFWLSPFGQLS
jgi:broad specificity phosphatase PhoE